jgi:murein L,D-transpeptidase YcbB/YkuD
VVKHRGFWAVDGRPVGTLSRRGLLAGFAGCAALAPVVAFAQESPVDALLRANQSRSWGERFDTGANPVASRIRSDVPLLSPETAAATEAVIPIYRDIASQGGWAPVPDRTKLRIGSRSPAVVALRQRLTIGGDLAPNRQGNADTFDTYVEAAVRRFQVRHGLVATGVVDKVTFDVMNVPADIRLRQLETNLVRLRSMSGNLGDRYVFVNIPGAEMEMVEAGRVVERHNAVVGKIDRQTPVLTSRITEINFNPFWHVPVSILRKDIVPKMRGEDPTYLAANNIRIIDRKGQEVDPTSVDWFSDQPYQYMFRQDPGEGNAMASVKISFPNPHDVYMHDTPFKDLFGDNDRFYSSGCMRIQNIHAVIRWLLRDTPNWGEDAIEGAFASGARVDAKLKTPVPVYTNYVTAWATRDGVAQFRDDIYSRDGIGELAALQQPDL